jgi:uncharacterized membrane protein
MDPYLSAKWLHILSSTVLFGTGIGTAFQMVFAVHSGNIQAIHSTAKGVVLADWLFTTPAGIVQPATGLWLIWLQGYALTESWLLLSYGLYIVAFCCWAPVVHLQLKIRNLTKDAPSMPPEAEKAFKIWMMLGWPAFAALVMVFWLMVHKPTLWG